MTRIVIRHLVPILALGLSFGLGTTAPATQPDESIEAVIDTQLPAADVPGLSYGVVADGEIAAAGARGVVRIGGGVDVTPDTPFLSGSISKSFTALAVMQLVEADEIELDESLASYLEGFVGRPAAAVTIRQLLSHTSGFSTLQGNESHTSTTGGRDELERWVDGLAALTPEYPPGERWEYSNTNYQILGRVIEVVSGQEFQAYVTAHILEPVGMSHSFVADGEIHDEMATGHRPWFGTKQPLEENSTDRGTAPQGGIVASATDLARYLTMMMNGEDDVLSAAGKTLMITPASEASPFYGFGWFVDSATGRVWHGGTSPGFETLATMLPAEHRAVVVLTNTGSGLGFGETADLLDGVTAQALDLEAASDQSRWSRQLLFVSLVLLPIAYLLVMGWAWLRRAKLRAKTRSGFAGLFSLWFPLLTTAVAAWVLLGLVPTVMASPIGTLNLFRPDLGLAFIASAVTGVLWAVFRLAVAYTGRSGATPSASSPIAARSTPSSA